MTQDRQFSDDEVAFILERAAAADSSGSGSTALETSRETSRGLTLQQLTDVAREAGISETAVTLAADAVVRGALVPSKVITAAGLPVGVSRTIELGRAVSETEWERLIVALRETFNARGKVVREGSLRSWHNGNLQASLEPTTTGHRLRLSTRKGDALSGILAGAALMIAGGMLGAATAFSVAKGAPSIWWPTVLMIGMGATTIASRYITLPRWARTRASQMEALGETATRILEGK
jgi:hypothetical protein